MGGGLAHADSDFGALPWVAALLGAIFIQIGTNFANDYSDFVRGADTTERLGTPRVMQSGALSAQAVRTGAGVSFLLAFAVGTYLVSRGGWPIVAIGLTGIAAGICYTGGPWPFGYRGLGDVFVFAFFGPIAVGGTYYVQTLSWSWAATMAGASIGALTTAILVVNNLRDMPTDRTVGKRTLAVILGGRATRAEYTLLLVGSMALIAGGVLAGWWPTLTLIALGAVFLLAQPLRTVWAGGDPRNLNAALAQTARATGVVGMLFGLGCVL